MNSHRFGVGEHIRLRGVAAQQGIESPGIENLIMSSIIESIFFPWGDKDELQDDSDPQASVGSYSFDDGQSLETFDINGVRNNDCDMFSSYENDYDKYGEREEARRKRKQEEREQKILNNYYDKGSGYQQSPIEWFVNSLGRSADYDLHDEQYPGTNAAGRSGDEDNEDSKREADKNLKSAFRIRRMLSRPSSPPPPPSSKQPEKRIRFRLPFKRQKDSVARRNSIDQTDSETDNNTNSKNDKDVVVTVVTKDTDTTAQNSDFSSMLSWGRSNSRDSGDEEQQQEQQQKQQSQYRTNATTINMTGELCTVAAAEDVASLRTKEDDFAVIANRWTSGGHQPMQQQSLPPPPPTPPLSPQEAMVPITTATTIPIAATEYQHPQIMLPTLNNNSTVTQSVPHQTKSRTTTITIIVLLSFMVILLIFIVIFMMLYIFKVISIPGIEGGDR